MQRKQGRGAGLVTEILRYVGYTGCSLPKVIILQVVGGQAVYTRVYGIYRVQYAWICHTQGCTSYVVHCIRGYKGYETSN